MQYQMRRYRIADGELKEFVDAWLTGVVPLREQFGFRFHGAWSIEESNEFVCVMSYAGSEGFTAADAAYYDSEERRQLSPDPAVHIVSSDERSAHQVL
ncbi:MAG: NIPSNAP family protein [Actinomycetota bacterium]|nr:NIPSNAP family protein [Actinomycetota bacterium]